MCTSATSVEKSQQSVPFAICQGSDPEHHCSTSMWTGPRCSFLGSTSAVWGLQFFTEQHQGGSWLICFCWNTFVLSYIIHSPPWVLGRFQAQLRPGDQLWSESMPCSMAYWKQHHRDAIIYKDGTDPFLWAGILGRMLSLPYSIPYSAKCSSETPERCSVSAVAARVIAVVAEIICFIDYFLFLFGIA